MKGDRIGSVKGDRIHATNQGARMSVKGDDNHVASDDRSLGRS